MIRLSTWQRLERGDQMLVAAGVDSNRAKIAEIERAQAAGLITSRYPPAVLLALILQIATVWVTMPPELAALTGDLGASALASLVREAVSVLLAPEK